MSRRMVRRREHRTRREFLAGVGLTVVGALAGCLGYRGTGAGREAPRTSGADTIARWTYDPALHGTGTGAVFYLHRERALSFAGSMPPATAAKYRGYLDAVPLPEGVAHADVREHLLGHAREGPRRAAVLFGDFPDGRGTLDVEARLGGEESVEWHAADGALVVAPPAAARATLAAGREGKERWTDDPVVRDALDALGPGDDVSLIVHPVHDDDPVNARFAGGVARGHRYVFGPEESESRYVFVFEKERQAERADVDAWLATERFEDYRVIAVSREGRVVVVDGTLPTHAV